MSGLRTKLMFSMKAGLYMTTVETSDMMSKGEMFQKEGNKTHQNKVTLMTENSVALHSPEKWWVLQWLLFFYILSFIVIHVIVIATGAINRIE